VKHLLIILSILLLSSPVIGQETGVLYQFKTTSGFIWKTFGKGKVQPKYEGEVSKGIPNGFGVLSYPFSYGKSVVGEWKVGKELNTEHYDNDGNLIGKWVNGKWELTYGILCRNLKDRKTGWSEKCNDVLGSKFVGDIENMKPNGQGTLTLPNEYTFTGDFKDGKFHGQGTQIFSNRDKYVGEFKSGKKHGKGTLSLTNGFKYVGKFKNGKKHGQGTLDSIDGGKYVGTFKNDKKSGSGTLTSPGGLKYVGEFKNGSKNGKGTFTWPDDGKYEGEWKDGKFHGQGAFTFSDKNIGMGEFRGNKPWNIITYDNDGNIIWKMMDGVRVNKSKLLKVKNETLFRDTPLAKWNKGGKKWHRSGDKKKQAKYVGKIVNGVPNGLGSLTFPSGSRHVGNFWDGKPWFVTTYDKNGNILGKIVNGVKQ
tara:strand:- start:167 stop:1429 length:1263 start_codon:yes stop_codon:yes gene_type:complete